MSDKDDIRHFTIELVCRIFRVPVRLVRGPQTPAYKRNARRYGR